MDYLTVPQSIMQDTQTHNMTDRVQCVTCVTLNKQISTKEKMRQLHTRVKEMNFLGIMLLQGFGKLPPDFMFHPLYMAFYTCTARGGRGRDNGPYADSFPLWCHFHGGGGGSQGEG